MSAAQISDPATILCRNVTPIEWRPPLAEVGEPACGLPQDRDRGQRPAEEFAESLQTD